MFFQQFALVPDDLLNKGHTLAHGQIAAYALIVDTTHGNRVDVFISCGLVKAVVPFLIDGLAISLVVPFAVSVAVPFALCRIIQQQGFTMRGGDNDAKGVANHLTLRMRVESSCAGMHGWCQHIGPETEKQFTYFGISPGTDIAQFLLKMIGCPGF